MNLLNEIFEHQRQQITRSKAIKAMEDVRRDAEASPPPHDFLAAIQNHTHHPALIAEIKRRSPSRGLLSSDFDPRRLAQVYQENGAVAISVLTNEAFFGGHLSILRDLAKKKQRLPLLRKDFLCDPYQIYEARAAGADAVLLIVAGVDSRLLAEMHSLAMELKMAPLVEVHTVDEIQAALDCKPVLIGINNRNLYDFSVRLETTLHLRPHIPPGIIVVAESGIHTAQDVACLRAAGIDAILVGEAIVTAADIAGKVRELAAMGAQT